MPETPPIAMLASLPGTLQTYARDLWVAPTTCRVDEPDRDEREFGTIIARHGDRLEILVRSGAFAFGVDAREDDEIGDTVAYERHGSEFVLR